MKKIAIIDYGMGNLFSVRQACISVGSDAFITHDPKEIMSADAIVLPGVGAFGDCMAGMERLDLCAPVVDFIASGRPFLGVCLGMQLLFTESEEFGTHKGLGVIPGVIRRFPNAHAGKALRVPHIGWEKVYPATPGAWMRTPMQANQPGDFMYFVHSYYALPERPEDILCLSQHGGFEFCSGVRHGNVFAVQFHPEKSADPGLRIYKSFLNP